MRNLKQIIETAKERKGELSELEGLIARPLPWRKLRKISDDRWLSMMTKQKDSAENQSYISSIGVDGAQMRKMRSNHEPR